MVRDVTDRRAHEAALTHRADHDSLTGLVNRSLFEARLSEVLEAHRRAMDPEQTHSIAVLFIDLDGFKPVNDKYGHAAGDAVLVAIAARLRESTRGTDLVGRLGGDEFAVLLEVRDSREIHTVAERILHALNRPIGYDGYELSVGASIGMADNRSGGPAAETLAPSDRTVSAADLLRAADAAMYAAKASGGRRYDGRALSSARSSAEDSRAILSLRGVA